MSKKLKPFLAYSELTDCIYIIDGNDKYEVTEQCIKAMKATNRMATADDVLDKIRAGIKANVLDKIRTEIMKLQLYKMFEGEDTFYIERDDALAIIDKYKESEDKG